MPGLSGLWSNPGRSFVDTASYGLPSIETFDKLQEALRQWRDGTGVWEVWQDATDQARQSFAKIVGVESNSVTVGASASQLIGMVASSLVKGQVVVVPELEFTSNLFPWLVAESNGIRVVPVPLEDLVDRVAEGCDLVATSAVQSSTGEVVDLEAIRMAAREVGATTVVDATQAIGWLPIEAGQFDVVVCSAYKWLCTPRGVAYMTISDRMRPRLTPTSAGWFAGEVVHDSYYGLPLRLAKDARRFDISPAWFSWVGAASANLDLLSVGIEKIHDHNVALTAKLAQALDLDSQGSAILSIKVDESLDTATLPFQASSRGGGLRVSFHLYNDLDDVDLVFETLKGKVIID